MSSSWRKWGAPVALGLALACGIGFDAAKAQFYFRPFAYSFRYDLPPADDDFEAPRFGSRRAVARILAREGFELVGPLGRRGDQIVATGLSRREGETRFFIDPFEGVILRAVSLSPPPYADRPQPRDDGFVPPLGGSHPVVKEIGRNRATANEEPGNERVRRLARPAPQAPLAEPTQPAARPAPQSAAPAPAASTSKLEAQKPIEWAPPAEISKRVEAVKPGEPPIAAEGPKPAESPKAIAAKPPEPAKPTEAAKAIDPKTGADKIGALPNPAQPGPAEAAKPSAPGPAAKGAAPRATAARSTGSSHRAIVPPKASDGVAAVTPAAPAAPAGATAHAPESAKTPQSVAPPKAR